MTYSGHAGPAIDRYRRRRRWSRPWAHTLRRSTLRRHRRDRQPATRPTVLNRDQVWQVINAQRRSLADLLDDLSD
jgi:hypothetical protein